MVRVSRSPTVYPESRSGSSIWSFTNLGSRAGYLISSAINPPLVLNKRMSVSQYKNSLLMWVRVFIKSGSHILMEVIGKHVSVITMFNEQWRHVETQE